MDFILQKLNNDKNRRFIAKMLGEQGGTTGRLKSAMTWATEAQAESFRQKHQLWEFHVTLSDGTDDLEKEMRLVWERKRK